MTTLSIHEAKATFSSLIARVEDRHEHVIICRYGRAVAELVPIARGKRTVVDEVLGKLQIHDDLTQPTIEEWNDA